MLRNIMPNVDTSQGWGICGCWEEWRSVGDDVDGINGQGSTIATGFTTSDRSYILLICL